MASIRARSDTGLLFFDIRYEGVRCREQTTLPDSPANRQKMSKVLRNIEKEIEAGTFNYRNYFPQSKLADRFDPQPKASVVTVQSLGAPVVPVVETPDLHGFR